MRAALLIRHYMHILSACLTAWQTAWTAQRAAPAAGLPLPARPGLMLPDHLEDLP